MKEIIEKVQCCGCIGGSDISCYEKSSYEKLNHACSKHCCGTTILGLGKILLGMPKGFNRIGKDEAFEIMLFEDVKDFTFDFYNIPVWKHITKEHYIYVRCLSPRTNKTSLIVFKQGDYSTIECCFVTEEKMKCMD